MSECIICLDPCTDHTHCCKAPIHASCLCEILEKGFGKCPHCQKNFYPEQEVQINYMALPIPVRVETETETETDSTCQNVIQVFGGCLLFMFALGSLSHYY